MGMGIHLLVCVCLVVLCVGHSCVVFYALC